MPILFYAGVFILAASISSVKKLQLGFPSVWFSRLAVYPPKIHRIQIKNAKNKIH